MCVCVCVVCVRVCVCACACACVSVDSGAERKMTKEETEAMEAKRAEKREVHPSLYSSVSLFVFVSYSYLSAFICLPLLFFFLALA